MSSSSADYDDARYIPINVDRVYAWRVDFEHLERLWPMFKFLAQNYDVQTDVYKESVGGRLRLHIIQDPYNASAGQGDWIVCGDSVRGLTDAEFRAELRKEAPSL